MLKGNGRKTSLSKQEKGGNAPNGVVDGLYVRNGGNGGAARTRLF
jgi:hypothetical protein